MVIPPSILAWEISKERRTWWAAVHGVTKTQRRLSNWARTCAQVRECWGLIKLSCEVIFEQRQRWSEGTNYASIWWKRVLRRNSRCQGPFREGQGNIWRPARPIGSKQGGNDGRRGIWRWARCLLPQVWQREEGITTVWKITVVVSGDWGSNVGRKTLSSVYSFKPFAFLKSCAWITF